MRSGPPLLRVAISVMLGLQAIRILFPIAFSLNERTNFIGAGGLVLVISLAPFLTPLARRLLVTDGVVPGIVACFTLAEHVVHPIASGNYT